MMAVGLVKVVLLFRSIYWTWVVVDSVSEFARRGLLFRGMNSRFQGCLIVSIDGIDVTWGIGGFKCSFLRFLDSGAWRCRCSRWYGGRNLTALLQLTSVLWWASPAFIPRYHTRVRLAAPVVGCGYGISVLHGVVSVLVVWCGGPHRPAVGCREWQIAKKSDRQRQIVFKNTLLHEITKAANGSTKHKHTELRDSETLCKVPISSLFFKIKES